MENMTTEIITASVDHLAPGAAAGFNELLQEAVGDTLREEQGHARDSDKKDKPRAAEIKPTTNEL